MRGVKYHLEDTATNMNTKKIPISRAIPGMILAEDVYTMNNHLVIAKDTTLTDKIITRLVFYTVISITIYDPSESTGNEMLAESTTYYDRIKNSTSFQRFHQAYLNTVTGLKASLDDIAMGNPEINVDKLISDTDQIINQSSSNIGLLNMLHCLRQYDDPTYIHSLNVGLVCNIIGKWLNFSDADIETITICGLLHDVGKLMIPNSIITKPAKLTDREYSTIKAHTIRGYNLLKNKKIDTRIRQAVLMHHERCDGSGYPYGFHGEQIDSFAKLVSIADVYDAMTSERVYRGPLCPFVVINIFETEGLIKYDPKYILTFMEGIVNTYIHTSVVLSDNTVGEIVFINKFDLSRPVVKIGNQFIDLSSHRDLYITSLI